MIVWLNGAFGSGKTTVARALSGRLPAARVFDPERLGYVLRRVRPVPTGDYQDLASWRWAVRTVLAARRRTLTIVPMTMPRAEYRAEILDGLRERGIVVRHVVLTVPPDVLRARIAADTSDSGALDWRLAQLDRVTDALRDLGAREPDTLEIDNADRPPEATAEEIIARCGIVITVPRSSQLRGLGRPGRTQ